MVPSDEIQKQDRKPAAIGPGDHLQAARIQQGLTIQDVASRMHLNDEILEAIENNNFEEITAPIFVKGYLRSFARIVALDEDEMIEQYIQYYSEDDPPISTTSNIIPELSINDVRIKWATYLVILILGSLLTVWWWNTEQGKEDLISLETQTTTEDPVETNTEMVSSEMVSSEIEADSESNQMTPENNQVVAESTTAEPEISNQTIEVQPVPAQPAPEPESSESADTIELADTIATIEPEVVDPLEVDPQSQITTQRVGNVTTRIAPTGSDQIHIVVHADTWADIEDSSKHRLVYDLLRADQTLVVTGEAPFSVFFGNGHGIEVKFNDLTIDVPRYTRDDNTVRLTLGR